MALQVHKFGGASVKDANAIKNLLQIIQELENQQLYVVISAMGKTTNALEKLLHSYWYKRPEMWEDFEAIKSFHNEIIQDLNMNAAHVSAIHDIYEEIHQLIRATPLDSFNQQYDSLVSMGEILSTRIIYGYLSEHNIPCQWLDMRKIIVTDSLYREAKVNWEKSRKRLEAFENHEHKSNHIIISQGFIASDEKGHPTTLGREGSDFSGAILAFLLQAESLSIWKDVDGVQNADPKFFKNTQQLEKLSYGEATELAYYGATVIHPKTLKPLQNLGIPLYVRSFKETYKSGSCIQKDESNDAKVPSYIFKQKQILISIAPRDFSFMEEIHLANIFNNLAKYHIKVNMMQNSALSFSICCDYNEEKISPFLNDIRYKYLLKYNKNLELLTIRNYTEDLAFEIIGDRKIFLEQKSRLTLQVVLEPKVYH